MSYTTKHYTPKNLSDRTALIFTKFLRFLADTSFRDCRSSSRYGGRHVNSFKIIKENARR